MAKIEIRDLPADNLLSTGDMQRIVGGNRTSVRDSRHGYRNIDTQSLVNRLERYAGITLLTGNLKTD